MEADDQKVKLASVHLHDKAWVWYVKFEKLHGENAPWQLFETEIYNRFNASYVDPMEELKNLR